jgi:hypothetical protein
MVSWFDRVSSWLISSHFFAEKPGAVLVKMNFGKMLVEQILQSLLLLISIGQLMGWSEPYVLETEQYPDRGKLPASATICRQAFFTALVSRSTRLSP